jgi:hypothetical protein
MCLAFAKAVVKLVSGALSHKNTGNRFGHLSSIFTFIFWPSPPCPDHLFELGPSVLRLESGRARVLWGLYGHWVSLASPWLFVPSDSLTRRNCIVFIDLLILLCYERLRFLILMGRPTGVR